MPITAMRRIWIGPDLPQKIKDSDKKWAVGAKPFFQYQGFFADHGIGNIIIST